MTDDSTGKEAGGAGRIFLTGASGFVGSAVSEELLARDYAIRALVRRPTGRAGIEEIAGDLFDDASLDRGMRGCDAVIHLVGIILEHPSRDITFERIHVEGTRRVIDAAKCSGVRRFIHMSALGTRPDAAAEYHRTKWKAEELVRASGLDWTIVRPSLIHGPGGFMRDEAAWARKSAMPFFAMPYFGSGLLGFSGTGLLQPVYVNDAARAFVDALSNPKTIKKTYELGGRDRFTWPEFHRAAARGIVGRSRLTAPIPAWFAKLLAGTGLAPLLGFNRDQVVMSQENSTCDLTPFEADFGWKPRPFVETLREYASRL